MVLVNLENGRVVGIGVGQMKGTNKRDDVPPLFGDAAAHAVMKWRFPETANGIFEVPVTFSLAELAAGRLVRHRIDNDDQ